MKSVLILAGGGGHTGYGVMLAEQLHKKVELHFLVPSNDSLSRKLTEKYGKVEELIKPRHPTTNYFHFVFRFIYALIQALFKVHGSHSYVISTGSNFCIPPSIIAWIKGIPIISIESADKLASASKTARYLQKIAKLTVLQWEEQKQFLDGEVFGPFFLQQEIERRNDGYLLVAGGTYGYKELIDAAINLQHSSVVLQIGSLNKTEYQKKQPEWRIFKNIPNFKQVLAYADMVITPPGATAMEAYSLGKPLVIIRYPRWSKAGTQKEAKLFSEKLNAPFIDIITTKEIENAIIETKNRPRINLENGAKKLATQILTV